MDRQTLLSLFVGRQRELEQLRSTLSSGARAVAISGPHGIGKKMMACVFVAKYKDLYPDGVRTGNGFLFDLNEIVGSEEITKPTFLFLEHADELDDQDITDLSSGLQTQPHLHLLLLTCKSLSPHNLVERNIHLSGLTRSDFEEFFNLRMQYLDIEAPPAVAERLFTIGGGNPGFAALALSVVKDGEVRSWDEFFELLKDFRYKGFPSIDGIHVYRESLSNSQLIIEVSITNDEILAMLRHNPALARKLPPRKFEEIVAELLIKQGYDIELTPVSSDGGFDIYAARKENLGRFLYLVECKRYTPPNKVGVAIVRSLHGVVQARRATAGVIVNTSFFTSGAEAFTNKIKYQMQLHDYFALQKWLNSNMI